MARYFLKLPVEFYQGSSLLCWAAGLASWLHATQIGNATTDQLLRRFEPYTNTDKSLPEGEVSNRPGGERGGMRAVFEQLAVLLVKMDRFDFTEEWITNHLRDKGHLLIMGAVGGDMGHTRVIYGVGYPPGHFSVFDPLSHDSPPKKMSGFRNIPIDDVRESFQELPIYVGWAKWAGPD
jgi:hypothetical protein